MSQPSGSPVTPDLWAQITDNPELAYEAACNPTTDPELLQHLATSTDARVREAIAQNPNTPTPTLFTLGAEFPAQLLDNPIFTLLLLETPNLAADLPVKTLRSLVTQPEVPLSFLVECALQHADQELLLALTQNPNVPAHALEKLVQHPDATVAESAKLHVNWADESINWLEVGQTAIAQIIRPVGKLSHDSIAQESLEVLVGAGAVPTPFFAEWRDGSWQGKKMAEIAARSPNSSPQLLEQLSRIDDAKLKLTIAANPHTPVVVFQQFAKSSDLKLKIAIAKNPNIPPAVLETLAKERGVIDKLADNMRVTGFEIGDKLRGKGGPTQLLDLIGDLAPMIAKGITAEVLSSEARRTELLELTKTIAANPQTPPDILTELAWDTRAQNYSEVRHVAIPNPNLPTDLLQLLFRGSDERTRRTCASNPKMPTADLERLLKYGESWTSLVAGHPNAPFAFLEKITHSSDPNTQYLRSLVAQNRATPSHLLKHLSSDPNHQYWIVQNPNTDADTLASIAFVTTDNKVRQAIASHPNTPSAVLLTFAASKKKLSYFRNLRPGQANKDIPVYAQQLSQNPNLPEAIARELIQIEYDHGLDFPIVVSQLLSHNPNLLTTVLEHYAKSPDLMVRVTVLSNSDALISYLEVSGRSNFWVERYLTARHPQTPTSIRTRLAQDGNRVVREAAKGWSLKGITGTPLA